MRYEVKEGRHHYKPNRIRFWRIPLRKRRGILSMVCSFDRLTINPPSSYPERAQKQINKLSGFSWWGRGRNRHSVRVGWRIPQAHPGMVEWFLYIRDKGKLSWFSLGFTRKDQDTEITLSIDREKQSVSFDVSQKDSEGKYVMSEQICKDFYFPQYCGYLAEPYYGGIAKAPYDMFLNLATSLTYR